METDLAAVTTVPPSAGVADVRPREIVSPRGWSDRVFHSGITTASLIVLSIMVAVGLFLTSEGLTALRRAGLIDFVTTSEWQTESGNFGIAALMTGTALVALIAVGTALPIAMGAALFVTEVAPRQMRSGLVAMIDLMAAVPSIVYGLWGAYLLQGRILGLSRWIATWFGWIPIFDVSGFDPSNPLSSASVFTASTVIAGVVVAMMVIPISCSMMREVFSQVPVGEREGAFALGATRWGMIRIVTLPFGRGGVIGGTMLGLGRALGETIAVLMILSPRFDINFHVLESGGNTVAMHIALNASEASGFGLSALMAAGLALFAVTLIVNFTASYFVARSRSGASSDA